MEEFRTMVGELRVQARRAYNEQLEMVKLLRERTKLQREALLPNMQENDLSNPSVRGGGIMDRHPDTEQS